MREGGAMAKARVRLTCPTCGEEYTWSVDCYNRREADEWESRHEGETDRECPACWRKTRAEQRAAERTERLRRYEELSRAAGVEPARLEGSEKQVPWAEDIRAEKVMKALALNGGVGRRELWEVANLPKTARWWIDMRDNSAEAVLEGIMLEWEADVRRICAEYYESGGGGKGG